MADDIKIPDTWGTVVESDKIFSAKTKAWYEVTRSVRSLDGTTVTVDYLAGDKTVTVRDVPADKPVCIERGPTGKVVTMFAVLFSGQTGASS